MINKLIFVALALVISYQANAATLDVDTDGNLLGASNVDVGGVLYDVAFKDGSCVDLYSGCDNASTDFVFTDLDSALLASQALLDQVFIDGVLGSFDSNPSLTSGCTSLLECTVITPYEIDSIFTTLIRYTLAINCDPSLTSSICDLLGESAQPGAFIDINTGTDHGAETYAVWAPINPIPIPAAVWLFGTALIGLFGFNKRSNAA